MEKITKCVVKRKGHLEEYDEKKVYASVYAAAIICEYGEKKAEKIPIGGTKKVNIWFNKEAKKKKCVNSSEIRDFIISNLKDEDTKVIYKHHLDLS